MNTQTQEFIDDLWLSFVADQGGKVTAEVLEEWRDRMGPMLDVMTAAE